jgi:hypothetical protein
VQLGVAELPLAVHDRDDLRTLERALTEDVGDTEIGSKLH